MRRHRVAECVIRHRIGNNLVFSFGAYVGQDSLHTAELQRMAAQFSQKQSELAFIQQQLTSVRTQLAERDEALEAAQRLSAQLERKEAAIAALNEEGNNLFSKSFYTP